jgi:hypothetical protein
MIKQLKGVPGVKPERLKEAMGRVRHCALSLVRASRAGAPILKAQPRCGASRMEKKTPLGSLKRKPP